MSYQESNKYKRTELYGERDTLGFGNTPHVNFEKHMLENTPANNPQALIEQIDKFCDKHWMMNLGSDKGKVVVDTIEKYKPKTILQLGTYVGYSSIVMANASKATIHTFDPSEQYSSIACKLHKHAGLSDLIKFHLGTIQAHQDFFKNHGPFDMIFIDHWKNIYLSDLKWLEEHGAITKGTVVVGDNIITPGSPDYLAYFKESKNYNSTLYHSNLEYCDLPDAVLVSERIN